MTTLMWVDVETDGLDPMDGHLLEVGLLATDTDLNPRDDGFSSPIRFDGPVDGFIERMHTPNGLLAECASAPDLDEVADMCRRYVDACADDGLIAAGSSVRFDLDWLDMDMPGLFARASHRLFDVSALDLAARMWYPAAYKSRPARTTDHRTMHCLHDSLELARHYRKALPCAIR